MTLLWGCPSGHECMHSIAFSGEHLYISAVDSLQLLY